MRRTRIAIALALLLAALPAGAAADKPPRLPKTKGWIECKSPHFTLVSSVSRSSTTRLASRLEKFRAALAQITKGFELDTRVPTHTFVFRNASSYRPYRLNADGSEMNVSGYFLPRPYRNYITIDSSTPGRPMHVVYHEYFHAVIEASIGDLPLWLNEGLAEYFSTFKSYPGSTTVEAGHPIAQHLAHLSEQGGMPWFDVFNLDKRSPAYNEGSRQGSFYAQSWLIVHYLHSTDEGVKALGRYLTQLRSGSEEPEAFAAAFGKSPAKLGADAEKYLETGSRFIEWKLGEEAASPAVEVRELEPSEVLYRLGELLAQRGQRPAARRHLDAAEAAGWNGPTLDTARAAAAFYAEDPDAAEALLRAAIEAESASPEPYAILGEVLLTRFVESADAMRYHEQTPAPILESRALFGRALELDSEDYSSLVGIAQTYLFEGGDTAPGAAALGRARSLRPLDLDLLQIQASLLARSGNIEAAWALVTRELAPRDPDLAQVAAQFVVDGVLMTAMRSVERDRDAALALIDRALATVDDARLRPELTEVREVIASGGSVYVAETPESEAAGAKSIEIFNRAATAAQQGNLDEAVSLLDELIPICSEPKQLCETAVKQRNEMARVAEHNRIVDSVNRAVELANAGEVKKAITRLNELEQTVENPQMLARVRELLKSMGARVDE
ncbi:MAG: hypothetical protein GY716_02365 [bacterium]|nr:hypothetical protein [bacterium]